LSPVDRTAYQQWLARQQAHERAVQAALVQTQNASAAVRQLAAQIAAQQEQITRLTGQAEAAQQQYDAQGVVLVEAEAAAAQAQAAFARADARYRAAHEQLLRTAVATYEAGSDMASLPGGTVADLLVAPDPNSVLTLASAQQQVADRQTAVVREFDAARLLRQQANLRLQAAVGRAEAATERLAGLRDTAAAALEQAQQAMVTLQGQLRTANVSQQAAQTVLSGYLGGWSTAAPTQAAALNRQWEQQAEQKARTLLAPPPTAAAGGWSPAIATAVVQRALGEIGVPYAWAGGNAEGATTGVCVAGAAAHDCQIIGFDCSGLALYSWAPYLSMPHLAASQYHMGSVHPTIPQLLPGDLVFWSYDGTAAGIHHVAIYIGNGMVIQAPQSGDIVRVTPLADVSSGYFGATRPLT
jgi:cell wall-associated NlpC family hydrolase